MRNILKHASVARSRKDSTGEVGEISDGISHSIISYTGLEMSVEVAVKSYGSGNCTTPCTYVKYFGL